MDYGAVIREAWSITRRYRFLWLLGLLAGGAVGVPSIGGGNGGGGSAGNGNDVQNLNPSIGALGEQVQNWAVQNAGLLIGAAAVAVVVALILLVLSFVAQGAMARATADLASGHASSFGRAWLAGVHLFWRYVGLWAVLVVASILVAAIVGAVIAAVAAIAIVAHAQELAFAVGGLAAAVVVIGFVAVVLRTIDQTTTPRWLIVLVATLFALPIFTVLLAAGLTLSIVVAFAQRAIAVEDIGPIDALQNGWQLTRRHFGDSLLTWLVNVGLAIATGLMMLLGLLGALVFLGGIGAVLFVVAGFSAPTLVYLGAGALLLVVAGLTVAGIGNAFFWTYWTLAYLRLTDRQAPAGAAA